MQIRTRTILLLTLFLMTLAMSGCKLKGSQDNSGSNEIWADSGGVGAEKQSIVVSLVELKGGAYLGRVALYVPASLMNAEVTVNGSSDSITVEHIPEQNLLTIDMSAAPDWDNVDISFKSSGSSLATCTIRVKGSVYPSGDCSW
jgi:hypothetical protein